MKLDPTKMKNWEIAEAAENNIKSIFQLAEEIGLQKDELLPAGHTLGKVHFTKVLDRLKNAPTAKYIDVTAITPTPFGEGKTTTTIGLIQGLAKCGKRPTGAIRQPMQARPSMSRAAPPEAVSRNAFLLSRFQSA